MKKLVGRFLGLVAVTMLAGCGGSSGGTCSNAAPCGGDIVGTWKITSSCLTVDVSSMSDDPDCPGLTAVPSDFKINGMVTYNAGLTYSATSTVTGKVLLTFPASCLKSGTTTVTCPQVQDVLEDELAGSEFSSVTCAASGAGCVCTFVVAPETHTVAGTYMTTAAGVLTETETGGTPDTSAYCVKGSTLTESPDTSSMMGQDGITGTITLMKQ